MNNGYSALWLIILYIIGSYFGKYIINNEKNENLKYFIKWILIYIFLNFLNYELNFWFIYKKNYILKQTFFKKYINPIVLLQAISLLMIFSKLKIKINYKKLFRFFLLLFLESYYFILELEDLILWIFILIK